MKRTLFFILAYVSLIFIHGCIRDEVLLPPTITSLGSVRITAGSILVVKGSNFHPQTTEVYIDETAISLAGTPTATQLQIIVPFTEHSMMASLYVKTRYGSSPAQTLTILPPSPQILKVIPKQAGAGKRIKLEGSYLNEVTKVEFKSPDQPDPVAAEFTKINADTLAVFVPEGLSEDAADIRIFSTSGQSEPAAFTVLPAPHITNFTPESGGIGTVVQIAGDGFAYLETVMFGELAGDILSASGALIEVRVPEEAVSDTIFVFTGGGKAKTSKKFGIIPKPVINSLDKTVGGTGTVVAITGENFTGALEVRFGNTVAPITSNTGTVIKTQVPAGASSGKVSVTTPAGTGLSAVDFMIQGGPLISAFTPASGNTGTVIIVSGLNLSTVTSARVGLKDLKIDSKTDTEITLEVLAGSVTGTLSVGSPGGTFQTTDFFVITGSPQITAINPASGAPGTIVTITGINFPDHPDVKFFDNVPVTTITKATATEIVCQVPAGAAAGKINVAGALSPADFVVNAKPIITSITPIKGGANKEITITGAYLAGATVKFVNNITAAVVGTATHSQIVVKVPVGAVTGKISITNGAGTTTAQNDFEILGTPAITSFIPVSGTAGTIVTITGTNLQYTPEVRFTNNVLAVVQSVSATKLVVVVPVGTTTGPVSVRTDAVATAVASSASFTVTQKPLIQTLSPATGTINEKITLTGTNFNNFLFVTFDGIAATTILSTSPTTIVARVPATVMATFSRSINVQVKTTADNSNNKTFSLLGTPVITKVSPDKSPSGWAFLIEGTNLNAVKKITIDGKVPSVGSNGVDQKAYNYLTSKVPTDVRPPSDQTKTIRLYYTSDDFEPVVFNSFTVLKQPPPGVFPPASIILPPPIPVNYVGNNLNAFWHNANFVSKNGDSVHCFNVRGDFQIGESDVIRESGTFCQLQEYFNITDEFFNLNTSYYRDYAASWDNGKLTFTSNSGPPATLKGQVVLNAQGLVTSMLLTDQNGYQLQIVGDADGGCLANSENCEDDDQ